mmetsp:Transcript_111001/g.312974  ORF Transcript_111001/g.312974 Transcript_111001/m.312974 type:complete len:473 (-) Transcript_111001:426-1844(-)
MQYNVSWANTQEIPKASTTANSMITRSQWRPPTRKVTTLFDQLAVVVSIIWTTSKPLWATLNTCMAQTTKPAAVSAGPIVGPKAETPSSASPASNSRSAKKEAKIPASRCIVPETKISNISVKFSARLLGTSSESPPTTPTRPVPTPPPTLAPPPAPSAYSSTFPPILPLTPPPPQRPSRAASGPWTGQIDLESSSEAEVISPSSRASHLRSLSTPIFAAPSALFPLDVAPPSCDLARCRASQANCSDVGERWRSLRPWKQGASEESVELLVIKSRVFKNDMSCTLSSSFALGASRAMSCARASTSVAPMREFASCAGAAGAATTSATGDAMAFSAGIADSMERRLGLPCGDGNAVGSPVAAPLRFAVSNVFLRPADGPPLAGGLKAEAVELDGGTRSEGFGVASSERTCSGLWSLPLAAGPMMPPLVLEFLTTCSKYWARSVCTRNCCTATRRTRRSPFCNPLPPRGTKLW